MEPDINGFKGVFRSGIIVVTLFAGPKVFVLRDVLIAFSL